MHHLMITADVSIGFQALHGMKRTLVKQIHPDSHPAEVIIF